MSALRVLPPVADALAFDIAALTGLGPNGPESVVFVLVLVACVYAVVRVWRREHTYA